MEYIDTFKKFDFLYLTDLQSEYAAFMATEPSLEAFENEAQVHGCRGGDCQDCARAQHRRHEPRDAADEELAQIRGGDVEEAVRQKLCTRRVSSGFARSTTTCARRRSS